MGILATAGVAAAFQAPVLLLPVGAYFLLPGKRKLAQSDTHGSASFATASQLARKGWFGPQGFLIGMVPAPSWKEAWRHLRKDRWADSVATMSVVDSAGKGEAEARIPNAIHCAIICPTGGGKTQGFVLRHLKTNSDSCLIFDMKGECAKLTAEFRKKTFGHKCYFLDPFNIHTQKSDSLNPFDQLRKDDKNLINHATSFAETLIPTDPKAHDSAHWEQSARIFIIGIVVFLVMEAPPEELNLTTLCHILSSQAELAEATKRLKAFSDPAIARLGHQMDLFQDKERGSVLTTVARALAVFGTPAVSAVIKTSSFSPGELKTGLISVYMILPVTQLKGHVQLIRAWTNMMLHACVQHGLGEEKKVHVLLDEFPSLGHMESVESGLVTMRGFGIRFQLYVQSSDQFEKSFPGQASVAMANLTQIFCGVNDVSTGEYVSKFCSTTTAQSVSLNDGDNSGYSTPPVGPGTASTGRNRGMTISEVSRPLLTSGEVINLGPKRAIVLANGMPPVISRVIYDFEEQASAGKKPRKLRRWAAIFVMAAILAAMLVAK
ncbi:type IV secretory system conjugative DNA transfer family protein [Zavarzinella formosa]|uniref:type IV secretory system conjugative DNA transfer family protein n=1 Tax=Zavarzinella formosa TaxID=360055 RepID=UPI0004970A62|nr:type IV secretory system conjugative DNA transfer family protein [Zavarzinella formosa]